MNSNNRLVSIKRILSYTLTMADKRTWANVRLNTWQSNGKKKAGISGNECLLKRLHLP